MTRSNVRIRWILLSACVSAFLAVAPCSHAGVIQNGTTEFCQLSGFVYHDLNNDGTRGPKEWFIPEVEIRLTGMTFAGDPIDWKTDTGSTGTYLFKDLPAGTYAVEEIQPYKLHTAIANAVGSAGGGDAATSLDDDTPDPNGVATGPNEFINIRLESGSFATNYNFGERGLKAIYMTKQDFIVVEVPEATTLSMLCVLFSGIALYRFRRRRA